MNIQRCGLVNFGEEVRRLTSDKTYGFLHKSDKSAYLKQGDRCFFSDNMPGSRGYGSGKVVTSFSTKNEEGEDRLILSVREDGSPLNRNVALKPESEIYTLPDFEELVTALQTQIDKAKKADAKDKKSE